MPLVLTDADVTRCIAMGDAVAAIEAAYREQAAGRAIVADRINLPLPNGWIRLMPAVLLDSGVLGYKEFHLTRIPHTAPPYAEVRYTFQLFDYATGALLATLDANYLTAIRTGATAGVALKYLAPPDSAEVGVIGSGAEARTELAAVAVIAEAYVQGVSTRKVEALVQALGISGISKSEVSRLAASLDAQVEAFRMRRLDASYPYLWVDARYEHVRDGGRVVSMAVIVAYGVRADGVREVLGLDVGLSEDVVLWRAFFQSLVGRGLQGVQLVISDAHAGLKQAIREVFVGAAWQRCRVHFMRNLLARVPKTAAAMVAATVRTIFQQPDRASAQRQLREVCQTLQARFPHAVALLEAAEEEVFTFYDFPAEHRRQIYSTNPLERLNKELKRRSAVVGIFPNRAAVIRLLGALLAEQNDEWLVGRHYFSETSMHKLLHPPPGTPLPMALEESAS